MLVHPAGFVLTCAHIIDDRSVGEVRFNSKDVRPFTVVARIPQHDVALLKTQPPDSASVAVSRPGQPALEGEQVFLIGNLGNNGLATIRGNVGATGRETRTDFVHVSDTLLLAMSVVPGASGGPIFDEEGRLLAMFFAFAYARPNGANSFAHAIEAPQLAEAVHSVVNLKSGFGLTMGGRLNESAKGCVVGTIETDSPAAEAGLQVGDAIVRVGQWDVHSLLDFVLSAQAWAEQGTDVPLELTVERSDEQFTKTLALTRHAPQPIPLASLTQVKPGSQLVVTELAESDGEGRELLRAWVRSLDGAWTKLSEEDQARQTTSHPKIKARRSTSSLLNKAESGRSVGARRPPVPRLSATSRSSAAPSAYLFSRLRLLPLKWRERPEQPQWGDPLELRHLSPSCWLWSAFRCLRAPPIAPATGS